jgi:hypothetical protein
MPLLRSSATGCSAAGELLCERCAEAITRSTAPRYAPDRRTLRAFTVGYAATWSCRWAFLNHQKGRLGAVTAKRVGDPGRSLQDLRLRSVDVHPEGRRRSVGATVESKTAQRASETRVRARRLAAARTGARIPSTLRARRRELPNSLASVRQYHRQTGVRCAGLAIAMLQHDVLQGSGSGPL